MAQSPQEFFNQLSPVARAVKDALQADMVLYNGMIEEETIERLVTAMSRRSGRRENVFLILTTYGGDPDAAYLLARSLQRYYRRFLAYVPGYCKSAGTLVLLGAHELVLSDHAQLGPLDIQFLEVGERRSALAASEALQVVEERTITLYNTIFDNLRRNVRLPMKVAAETASRLVSGLYRGSFGQVDTMRLGEMDRLNRIALKYGERLCSKGQNVKERTLPRLVGAYPHHEFIIDVEEARELFNLVRPPTEDERKLDDFIAMRRPGNKAPIADFIDDPPATAAKEPPPPSPAANEPQSPSRKKGPRPHVPTSQPGDLGGDAKGGSSPSRSGDRPTAASRSRRS